MAKSGSSKSHHWWPVALQKYWADAKGDVSWIDPNGIIDKKRFKNRQIGFKRNGHKLGKGFWEHNFENEFDIDGEIHNIILSLKGIRPLGSNVKEFFSILMLGNKNKSTLKALCKFYSLNESLHRNLLLLILSLMIRSPRRRSIYGRYPELIGMPANEEVGKANMRQDYLAVKKICQKGLLSNQYFIFMHSPRKKFIFGDGNLDWISLSGSRIYGRALLPLTPHLCIYFCAPMMMRTAPNCASLYIASWMVEWINDITQIYSKDRLFFNGSPPILSDAFRQREFLEHAERTDRLINMLDEIAGIK